MSKINAVKEIKDLLFFPIIGSRVDKSSIRLISNFLGIDVDYWSQDGSDQIKYTVQNEHVKIQFYSTFVTISSPPFNSALGDICFEIEDGRIDFDLAKKVIKEILDFRINKTPLSQEVSDLLNEDPF